VEQASVAVLAKATRLIDALAERGGEPATLSELAAAAELPQGTAGRLLKDLVQLGWADQTARRGGYRLGPRARGLGLAQRHRARFFELARDCLPALARRLGAPVSVACLRGLRRRTLHEWLGDGDERQPTIDERDDLWVTAGGRLLTAHLPAAERRQLITRVGLPAPGDWPGVATPDDLRDELAWIRRQNLAMQRLRHRPRSSAAVAVPDGEGGLLAVGFHVAPAAWNETKIADLRRTAAELAERIGSPAAGKR
jgi:IclR family acetate operon transcriptional repressor